MTAATAAAESAPAWRDLGAFADLVDGEGRAFRVEGHPVAIFRVGDEVFALLDQCPHGAVQLSTGYVEDGCVECPFHQALFDLRTGAVRAPPAEEDVRTYPVRIVDGRVEVLVEP